MRRFTLLALIACAVFAPYHAVAEEVGRATVSGRTVIIDSNGTWAYQDAAAPVVSDASCTNGNVIKSKKLPISLCITKPWRVDETAGGAMEVQATQTDLDMFVGLVSERTQMPTATLRQAILMNAASFAGVRAEDVVILKDSTETVNGVAWNYIEYEIVFSGAKFRFGNYHQSLGELGAAQMAFWSSAAYFDQNRPEMTAFMNGVRLTMPQ